MISSARGKLLAVFFSAATLFTYPANAADKFKIYLSQSYIGNNWLNEAVNMVKAMAASSTYKDKVDLNVQISGADVQKQIQQLNAMIQAGADAIIVYPVSETALNPVIRRACSKGIKVFAYDGEVSEPCAYNLHIDQNAAGRGDAEWLVKQLNGKGNIVLITGIAGTSVDTKRKGAALEVFAKYPDIHIIAEANGQWSESGARNEMTKILATHPWSEIDGMWVEMGCFTMASMQDEAGIPDGKKIPCAGEGTNGDHIQLLPSDTKVDGAKGTYKPMGYPGIAYDAKPYGGALAFKHAVDALEGKDVAKEILLPLPFLTNRDVVLCKTGAWKEWKETGCNAFPPSLVPDSSWFPEIFHADLPEIGLKAAMDGRPES